MPQPRHSEGHKQGAGSCQMEPHGTQGLAQENQTKPLVLGTPLHRPEALGPGQRTKTFSPPCTLSWCLWFPGLPLFGCCSLFFSGPP